jgi:hypothetical protein
MVGPSAALAGFPAAAGRAVAECVLPLADRVAANADVVVPVIPSIAALSNAAVTIPGLLAADGRRFSP